MRRTKTLIIVNTQNYTKKEGIDEQYRHLSLIAAISRSDLHANGLELISTKQSRSLEINDSGISF